MPAVVHLVTHGHGLSDSEVDQKLIGVFASERDAADAIQKVATLPGFAEHPNGFVTREYRVGTLNEEVVRALRQEANSA